jgi:hypothetical protein
MAGTNPEDFGDPESLVDYIIHQYGLTRDQAREIVRRHGGDRGKIDAAAGQMKAARK